MGSESRLLSEGFVAGSSPRLEAGPALDRDDGFVAGGHQARKEELIVLTERTNDTGMLDSFREVVDGASAGRVFGYPISHAGVIALPTAKVSGGAGGGSGLAEDGHQPGGTGGGFGMSARPVGVFVIRQDGKVVWRPAVDVNKIILGGQIVALAALLVARAFIRSRATGATCGAAEPPSGRMRSTRHLH